MTRTDDSSPSALDLIESARVKYQSAQARIRRGPPELALLSLHGSLEDALRSHALRRQLPAAYESFPQLLDGLVADRETPLTQAEAEGIRRMHKLRARVAHGEHITLAQETLDAYQRLVVRLLNRYGVQVIGPEDDPTRRDITAPMSRDEDVPRARTTTRLKRDYPAIPPPRERSAYPDDQPARYSSRPRRRAYEEAEGGARGRSGYMGRSGSAPDLERMGGIFDFFGRSQPWMLPLLIIVSIFLIGAAISIGLQQMRAGSAQPTAIPTAAGLITQSSGPVITTTGPISDTGVGTQPAAPQPTIAQPVVTAAPTVAASGKLAPGQVAYVRAGIEGLNLRAQANANAQVIIGLAPGSEVEIIEGPVSAGGKDWWRVRARELEGMEGWCAGEFLEVR